MPANVESMAYTEARGVPWHGEGRMIESLASASEMIEAAGLNWDVACEPIITAAGEPIDFKRAVVRQSDRSVLGVVGMGYEPVQNAHAFDFADAIVADQGNHFDTAGSLDGGKTVFVSLDLDAVDPITVNGDPSDFKTFLLIANAHDGSKALRATITPVRVVCQNTLNLALGGAKNVFSVRHSGDVASKMEAAREALNITVDYMRRFESVAAQLMATTVSDDRAEKVVRDAFQMRTATEETPDSEWFIKHHATQALDLLDSDDLAAFKGTGWAIVNAVAAYVDHDRTYGKATDRDALDVKMTSILWGNGSDIVNRTAALIDPKIAKIMDRKVVRQAARVATRVRVNA